MFRKLLISTSVLCFAALPLVAQQVAPTDSEKKAQELYSIAIAGSGGYMGVGIKDVSSKNFQELGLSEVKGVAITSIQKESAAEKAGLTKGDVIVAIDGQRVTSTRKFRRMVREIAPDHTVNLTVVRGGSEIQVPLTMGARKFGPRVRVGNLESIELLRESMPRIAVPDVAEIPELPRAVFPEGVESLSFSTSRMIGVSGRRMSKQLGEYFGVENGNGILVDRVTKDGPAAKAGLKAGDVIVKVNDKAVKNTFDLMRNIGKEGDVTVTFIRDRSEQTVTVTPEKRKGSYYYFKTKKDKDKDDN